MRNDLKRARDYLKASTRAEFEQAVYDSKLTPIQEQILRLHILSDKTISGIALTLNCSEACVGRALKAGYQQVFRLIFDNYMSASQTRNMT